MAVSSHSEFRMVLLLLALVYHGYLSTEHDRNEDPQQGFRASPFIAQVCRQWKRLLESHAAQVRPVPGSDQLAAAHAWLPHSHFTWPLGAWYRRCAVQCLPLHTVHAVLQELLYRHVVLDFGHELLNGVYWPLKYQNEPMTQSEFVERLVKAQLSVPKVRKRTILTF